MKKIACIVVTYNRKELLIDCLNAVAVQTFKPKVVFIVDNASSDGTEEKVRGQSFFNCTRDGVEYKYIRNSKNEGGAGGFYLGMKTAYESQTFDGFWLMDDDGIPDKECLMHLQQRLDDYDCLSPLVIAKENEQMTAFFRCSVGQMKQKAENGIVHGDGNPFNGILYSYKLVSEIGFPKKEMFIWGDELNYTERVLKAGFEPVIVVDAIHRHPMDRQKIATVRKKIKIRVSDSNWKLYCYIRNVVYNYKIRHGFLRQLVYSLRFSSRYFLYYLKEERDFSKVFLILDALVAGLVGYFNGMNKYFK